MKLSELYGILPDSSFTEKLGKLETQRHHITVRVILPLQRIQKIVKKQSTGK